MRQDERRLAAPGQVERRRRPRVNGDAAAIDAELDAAHARGGRCASPRALPSCAIIAASRADDGAGRPCWRRNQRSRLRARCSGKRGQRGAIERDAIGHIARVERRQVVGEPRGLGLMRGRARERGRGIAETRRPARASPCAARRCAGNAVCALLSSSTQRKLRRARVGIDVRARNVEQRPPPGHAARDRRALRSSPRARADRRRAAVAAAASRPGRRDGARARRTATPRGGRHRGQRRVAHAAALRFRDSSAARAARRPRAPTARRRAPRKSLRRSAATRPRAATGRDGRAARDKR